MISFPFITGVSDFRYLKSNKVSQNMFGTAKFRLTWGDYDHLYCSQLSLLCLLRLCNYSC